MTKSIGRRAVMRGAATAATLPFIAAPALAKESAVETLAEKWVKERRGANMVITVGRGPDPMKVAAAGKLRLGEGPKAGADTIYRMYSMTKPVTGIAAMLLIEEGRLALDQPLHEIFPAFRDTPVIAPQATDIEDVVRAERPITIRNLLTHTSGLIYANMSEGPVSRAYNEQGIAPGAFSMEAEARITNRPPTLIAFAERVATIPLAVQPGTAWIYSISLDVLGAVIEKVSGTPFDRFLAERLFEPLGMADTGFMVPPEKLGRFAANYSATANGLMPLDGNGADSVFARPPAFPYGGAGMVSTPRDYDRFLTMLLGEGQLGDRRVMKAETARLAMSNLLPPGVIIPASHGFDGFGAGGKVHVRLGPAGQSPGSFGWSGAASTHGWIDPIRRLRIGGYTQVVPPTLVDWSGELALAVFGDFT